MPGRLGIAGFDDQEIASQCVPALSTIHVPRHAMGWHAGAMLRRALKGQPVERGIVDVGFELMLRESF